VLEMLMESVFVVADVFFVGRLGPDAVATVGITESWMTVMYALAAGLSIGAMAMVARRIGEKDRDGAARAGVQSILLGLAAAITLGAIGALFGPHLLAIMGASDDVLRTGATFSRVMLGGCGTVLMLFLMNAVFRGAGDAAIAMRVLMLGNFLNIVLGPCFIFGLGPFPHLGVAGAAVATNIGRGTAVIFQLVTIARGHGRIHVGRKHFRLDMATMRAVLKLSGSGTFQILIGSTSYVGVVRILSQFGSDALAGYTIGMRIVFFALLPAFGVSNAAATMVGQNLGAGSPGRAETAVWTAVRYNMVFLGTVGALFLITAPSIIAIFTRDGAVAPFAIACLRTLSLGFIFYACGMVLSQSFNGAGDTWTPTWINLSVFWVWEIPLAWFLSTRTPLGASGVFVALALAFSTLAVVSAVIFRRGHWKTRAV
jgi:MATE family, multidrug efflux pump